VLSSRNSSYEIRTGMTKSSFWASSLIGKDRPYSNLFNVSLDPDIVNDLTHTRSPIQRLG
jgi:hypothetical protein